MPEWGNAKAFELLSYKIAARASATSWLSVSCSPGAQRQLGEDVTKYAVHVKGIAVGAWHPQRKDGLTR